MLPLVLLAALQGPPEDLPRNPVTWEGLAARLEREAAAGFEGAVLVVRDGAVVLERAFGRANREKGIAHRSDTVFAIGSTPIDFTRAAILFLAQVGQVELEAPLGQYLEDAPADKRAITLGQLLSGRSGLIDFVDTPEDRDPDHAWIDRAEFLRRVWASRLLFPPGSGEAHSHVAFGVLAAVVEVVSGQSYPEFCEENLFTPAGMVDTGFFGEPIAEERLAIGYGPRKDGEVNAPPFWGRTSWLVMGSGGQVSTLRDLWRWQQALRAGKLLEPEYVARYFGPPGAILNGGDMYGFEIYYSQDARAQFFLVTNAAEDRARRRAVEALANDLAALVSGR